MKTFKQGSNCLTFAFELQPSGSIVEDKSGGEKQSEEDRTIRKLWHSSEKEVIKTIPEVKKTIPEVEVVGMEKRHSLKKCLEANLAILDK